ncbi:hypothetical protein ACVIGB_001042 [Bradyrhizobium sp. USDA 4341]
MTTAIAVLFGTRSPEEVASTLRSLDLVDGEIEVLKGRTPRIGTLLFFAKGRPNQRRSLWVVNSALPHPNQLPAERTLLIVGATRDGQLVLETLTKASGGYLCRRDNDQPKWLAFQAPQPGTGPIDPLPPEEMESMLRELEAPIRSQEYLDDFRAVAMATSPTL